MLLWQRPGPTAPERRKMFRVIEGGKMVSLSLTSIIYDSRHNLWHREIRMPDPTYNLNGGFKPTMKRFADLSGPDFFPTPPWATFALIDNEKFNGEIWESACGDGTMSRVLEQRDDRSVAQTCTDRGYGEIGFDFLDPQWSADNIVTNPPYNCGRRLCSERHGAR